MYNVFLFNAPHPQFATTCSLYQVHVIIIRITICFFNQFNKKKPAIVELSFSYINVTMDTFNKTKTNMYDLIHTVSYQTHNINLSSANAEIR